MPQAAQALSAGPPRRRRQALDAAVMAELPDLKLERAAVHDRDRDRPETRQAPKAIDRVEFWVQTNPGTRAGPLAKIASGGELSRFMLALKVALADRGSAPTLVFDEIDTGVGGAVADAIGAQAVAACARRAGALRHARAAGRGPRRPALSHLEGASRRRDAGGHARRGARAPGSAARRSRACWRARR